MASSPKDAVAHVHPYVNRTRALATFAALCSPPVTETPPPPAPPAPTPPPTGPVDGSRLRVTLTLIGMGVALLVCMWAWKPARAGVLKPDSFTVLRPSDVPKLTPPPTKPPNAVAASHEAVKAAEQLGRVEWSTTALFFLLIAAIVITYAGTVLVRVIRIGTAHLAKIAVGIALLAFLVTLFVDVDDLRESAWDEHEVPRVLTALGVPTKLKPPEHEFEHGDVANLRAFLMRTHILSLLVLGAALVSLVGFAFSNDIDTIAWAMARLRNILLCGGALLAVSVALTNSMLTWPVDMLTASGIQPITHPSGATAFDLIAQVAEIGKAETTFDGMRWSLVLAAGFLAVHALLGARAHVLMRAKGGDDAKSPGKLSDAMQAAGVKVDWKGALGRVMLILAPFLSATLVSTLRGLIAG